MKYVLALDQGTTSSRALLFDRKGVPIALAQREFRQIFPQPGWVEHDAEEIWSTQLACAQQVLRDAKVDAREVAAIGITNQRETTVLWERSTGRPLANALVWQDRRTADRCAVLRSQGIEPMVSAKTGLLLDPYFSGTKLAWLLDSIEGARARAERGELAFGTIDSWLIWKLTAGAVHATDVSNASRTLLFNIETLDWDDELLQLLNVPRKLLPEVKASSEVIGQTSAQLFGQPLAIAGNAGDQQAATFGQACFGGGMTKNTYGTGCFMLMNVGDSPRRSKNQLLSTVGWTLNEQTSYLLEGSVFIGGAVVQWLRDGLQLFQHAEEVERLAAQAADNGGVYLVPAFVGLGCPYWDANARGMMIGITRGTTRAHVARAALESIAFQSAEVLQAMQRDAAEPLKELRVDGGAARNNLLMQFQADVVGVPVVRPEVTETTALGAAFLAGLATGFWADRQEIEALWKPDCFFEPTWNLERRESALYQWRRAVKRAQRWQE